MVTQMKGNMSSQMTGVLGHAEMRNPSSYQQENMPPVMVDSQGPRRYGFNPDEGHVQSSPRKVISMESQAKREQLGPTAEEIRAVEEAEERLRLLEEQKRMDQLVNDYQKLQSQQLNPSQASQGSK